MPGSAQQASRDPTQGRVPSRDPSQGRVPSRNVSHGRGPRPDPTYPSKKHPNQPLVQPTLGNSHSRTSNPSANGGNSGEIRPAGWDSAGPSSRSHSRGQDSSQTGGQAVPSSSARLDKTARGDYKQEPGASSRQDSRQRSRPPSAPRNPRGV